MAYSDRDLQAWMELGVIPEQDEELLAQLEEAQGRMNPRAPEGRAVGSRNTFVAASPLEHLARYVGHSRAKGEALDAKLQRGNLREKQRVGRQSYIDQAGQEDIYSHLIGEPPTTLEQQKAVADSLRRRRQFGELGSLTGDRVLQSFGNNIQKQTDDVANQLSENRFRKIDDDQTKVYQTGQLDHMRNVETETARNNDLDFLIGLLNAQANQDRADNPRDKPPPRLRESDIKRLEGLSQDMGAVEMLEGFIEKGGKFGAVEVAGTPIPMAREASNWLASKGMGTDSMKQSAMMKQQFDQFYTLAARNRMFGATLTPNEQIAWNNANASVAMTDQQNADLLSAIRKVKKARLDNTTRALKAENYNKEAVDAYADVPGLFSEDQTNDSDPGVDGMTPRQRRIAELRAKRGATQSN